VPRATLLATWPERTGLVRLIGRRFAWFVGAAAVVVLSLAFGLCAFAENAVAAGAADDIARCVVGGESPASPRTWVSRSCDVFTERRARCAPRS
jgi:hypothetical protein